MIRAGDSIREETAERGAAEARAGRRPEGLGRARGAGSAAHRRHAPVVVEHDDAPRGEVHPGGEGGGGADDPHEPDLERRLDNLPLVAVELGVVVRHPAVRHLPERAVRLPRVPRRGLLQVVPEELPGPGGRAAGGREGLRGAVHLVGAELVEVERHLAAKAAAGGRRMSRGAVAELMERREGEGGREWSRGRAWTLAASFLATSSHAFFVPQKTMTEPPSLRVSCVRNATASSSFGDGSSFTTLPSAVCTVAWYCERRARHRDWKKGCSGPQFPAVMLGWAPGRAGRSLRRAP